MKEDQKYRLEIKESGEVEQCVKFGPIYNPFKVSSHFNYVQCTYTGTSKKIDAKVASFKHWIDIA